MSNIEKYNQIFTDTFGASASDLNGNYTKENVEAWDSVHQLSIIAELEEQFDLMLDPEDIMACTSYEAGKDILRKYKVEI